MKHELIQMKKQQSGAIVNNSSLAGKVGVPGRIKFPFKYKNLERITYNFNYYDFLNGIGASIYPFYRLSVSR